VKSIQLLKALLSIIFGNLISIFTDYFLSFLGPIRWLSFYPQYIGIILGSFIAGFIVKKRGWLIGIVVSIVHIICIILLLSYPREFVAEEASKIDWFSILPTGGLLIIVGLVAGYCGEKITMLKKSTKDVT
jgi:putative membrane protein (TIGR04086 family)